MKNKPYFLLLLTAILPLSSCNSLKNKEIVAGEFVKGGKEISYQQIIDQSNNEETEQFKLPDAFRYSLTSNNISLSQINTFKRNYSAFDGYEVIDQYAKLDLNNLNSTFEIDGLTTALSASELKAKASLSFDMLFDMKQDDVDNEYELLFESLNNKSININAYLANSNFYLDMDDNTNGLINGLLTDITIPNKFYLDSSLLLSSDMFPILTDDLINEEILGSYKVYDITESSAIIAEELFSFRQYNDEFLAVINFNNESLSSSLETLINKLYEEDLLDETLGEKYNYTRAEVDELINEMKEDVEPIKSLKATFRFNKFSVIELAFDILYEEKEEAQIGENMYYNTTTFDVDFKMSFETGEDIEINMPEFDSSYKSLLASLGY